MKIRMSIVLLLVALWFVACIALSGCVTMPHETLAEEAAYQSVAAVDMADTLRIAHCPDRWNEDNRMLGQHPKTGNVAAYFVAFGVAHAAATDYLVAQHAPKWVVRGWEASTIAFEGRALAINYSIGVRP